MQSGRRLVQYIQCTAGAFPCKLRRQLHPLAFSAGERDCRLSQPDIPESDIRQGFQLLGDGRYIAEKFICFAYGHFQNIIDVLPFVFYCEGVFLVTASPAFFADHIDRRQEIHFDYLDPCTLALLATSSRDIERESSCLESAHLGVRSGFEEGADIIEYSRECGRIAPRCPSYRRLVYLYQLVYVFHSHQTVVGKRLHLGVIEPVLQDRHQSVVYERRFSAAAHSADADEYSEREVHTDVFQIVAPGSPDS